MMREMIGSGGEVEAGGLDAGQDMVLSAAQIEDAVGGNDRIGAGAACFGGREPGRSHFEIMIGTDPFKSLRESFAEISAAGLGSR